MDRRLLVEYMRWNARGLCGFGLAAAMIWFGAGTDAVSVPLAMAASLVVAFVAGPMLTFQSLAPPEIQVLPISRRAIWRTGWWLSVIVPVGVLTTGKFLGFEAWRALSTRGAATVDVVWLSSLYDLAQAGALLGVMRVGAAASGPRAARSPRSARIALTTLAIALVLAAMTWPWTFLFLDMLPTRWDQLATTHAAVILAGLTLTGLSYFPTPARVAAVDRAAVRAAWRRPSRQWTPQLAHVTGMWRLAFQTWKSAALTQIALPVLMLGATVVAAAVIQAEPGSWIADARDFGFLPFDGTPRIGHASYIALFFLGSLSLTWPSARIGYHDVIGFMLRNLRTLPMSTRQLNTVIIALPLVSWINLWLLLALFHTVVTGRPLASLRLAEWLAMIGCDALVRALFMKWRSYLWPGILAASALAVAFLANKLAFGALPAVAGVLGGIALFFAWAINHDTLTRSRLAYAPAKVPARFAGLYPRSD